MACFLFAELVGCGICVSACVWVSSHLLSFSVSLIVRKFGPVCMCVFLLRIQIRSWSIRSNWVGTPANMWMCLWMCVHQMCTCPVWLAHTQLVVLTDAVHTHTHTHRALFHTHVLGSHMAIATFFLYMTPVHTLNWRLYKVLFIISNQGVLLCPIFKFSSP